MSSSDMRQTTIDTYDRSAQQLADYFSGIGARTADIDRALELAGNPDQAKVVEIGCGDGRDAAEILKRTDNYTGFDISKGLLEIARARLPEANLQQADAVTYEFPPRLDVVFAFASLLHLSQDEVAQINNKVSRALKPKGIFYISLKYADDYQEYIKKDEYGRRQFYLYNPELIKSLAGTALRTAYEDRHTIRHTEWFELALQKQ